jgi:hypothetical protein
MRPKTLLFGHQLPFQDPVYQNIGPFTAQGPQRMPAFACRSRPNSLESTSQIIAKSGNMMDRFLLLRFNYPEQIR